MVGKLAGSDFSANSVRAYIAHKKEALAAEQLAHEGAMKTQREELHKIFLEREVHPDVLQRVETVVRRAVDAGDKQALLFQFPSDWLPDQGRAITSHDRNWHKKLDGFARRAYDYYERELAPRGFQLRAEIIDWPGGMPGDVGFFLLWKRPEEI
jgi:hypothetical protein